VYLAGMYVCVYVCVYSVLYVATCVRALRVGVLSLVRVCVCE
jgi:hypothetical protein